MMITVPRRPTLCLLEYRSFSPVCCRAQNALQSGSKALSFPMSLHFPIILDCQKTRRISVATQAGPSSNAYALAFALPMSLLAITIFTALWIGDKLDQKFLEELAINQAIREADEEEEDDVMIPKPEEPALPRARSSRPKREV